MGDRLHGKTAMITGAGSGIGLAMTARFAAEGAKVLAVDVTDGLDAAIASVRAEGGEVTTRRCDVADPDQVDRLGHTAVQTLGRLDILCNNAGIGGDSAARLHELSLATWDQVMNVNLRGAFLVLQQALRVMLAQGSGGAVVNTASIGSFRAAPGATAYICSKGGVAMLTRQAALEYAADGIRVNAVAPGAIDTPMVANAPAAARARLVSQIPQGRLGRAEEVAALALFLASDEASHISGQVYTIDGARSVV
jgi:meso-butanediol dehydrogenase/(S,S)-butanediol dehydrogenase/diacetyl reductase